MLPTITRAFSTSKLLGSYNSSGDRQSHYADVKHEFPPSDTIFVGNLPFNVEEREVRDVFEQFGAIKSIRISYRPDGTARGFGHVQFENQEHAVAANESAAAEPLTLMGRFLRVNFADTKPTEVKEPNRRLYFFDYAGEDAQLRDGLRKFGTSVISFRHLRNLETGQRTGAGFIEFTDVERATEALQELDGTVLSDGLKLNLRYAMKPRPSREGRDRRANYGGDWGGDRRSEQYGNRRRFADIRDSKGLKDDID